MSGHGGNLHSLRDLPGTYEKSGLNTGSLGFEIMDWWENYHGLVKKAEGNEFKFAKAKIDPSGNLKLQLAYEVIDPLSDIDILRTAENLG